mgnify:FL=1
MRKTLQKMNEVSVIITDFVFKKILLENPKYAAKIISWICNLDYEKVVKGHFIDPNLLARKSIEVHRVGDLIYKIDDNTYVDIEAYNKYSRNTDLKNLDYQNRAVSRFSVTMDKRGKKTYNTDIKIYFIAIYGSSLKSMPFIKYDFTFSQEFNNSQFVKISYVCLDKLETIKYTKGKQEMYEYFKALTRISLKDIENILANSRIVKKDKTLEGVYQSMLMFYKEDGSYDVKAFYEHRLIDEYQEGYGVGEDVGEARGLKRGQKIGMERGQKLGMERGQKIGMERGQKIGMERGQMLERTNIIGSLSNRGLSNDEISNITSIPIEEVERILNPDSLKLKRKIH